MPQVVWHTWGVNQVLCSFKSLSQMRKNAQSVHCRFVSESDQVYLDNSCRSFDSVWFFTLSGFWCNITTKMRYCWRHVICFVRPPTHLMCGVSCHVCCVGVFNNMPSVFLQLSTCVSPWTALCTPITCCGCDESFGSMLPVVHLTHQNLCSKIKTLLEAGSRCPQMIFESVFVI